MTYLSELIHRHDDEDHDGGIDNPEDVSIHHIAFVTRTLSKLVQFECVIVNQFLHHCHLFYPKYEEIQAEDFSEHIKMLKDFEIFLEDYRKHCEEYILITDENEEKTYRNSKLEPLRDELFQYWYRFYNVKNKESYTFYLQFENPNFLILSETAKVSIQLEIKYLDFNYKFFLSEFSRIMSSLDTNKDSPLFQWHLNTIQEDYRHWLTDLSFFHDRTISDLNLLQFIITKNLIPKRTDYELINYNIEKVNDYIGKLIKTIKEIYDYIDNP